MHYELFLSLLSLGTKFFLGLAGENLAVLLNLKVFLPRKFKLLLELALLLIAHFPLEVAPLLFVFEPLVLLNLLELELLLLLLLNGLLLDARNFDLLRLVGFECLVFTHF